MTTGIQATYVNSHSFYVTGNLTDVIIKERQIKADCGSDGFKYGFVKSVSFNNSDNITTVVLTDESDLLTDNLTDIWYEAEPHMDDGRPIVRSDTRPLNTQTYFTIRGDSIDSTSGVITICGGKDMRWDFSNDDDLFEGPEVPNGYKAKEIKISFACPVYLKDGTIYFFDAPWGSYATMDIMVPKGQYYPNPAGSIPASALGLSGNKTYALASEDTSIQKYIGIHYMYGNCPMGDELNAEGAAVEALPIGWYVRGLIITPEDDNISKGFASLEMYRCHSVLLPGQTVIH